MVLAVHPVDALQLCTLCQEHWPCRQQQSRTSVTPGLQPPPKTGVCLDKTASVPIPYTQVKKTVLLQHAGPLLITHHTESSINPGLPGGTKAQAAQGVNSSTGSTLGQRATDGHRHCVSAECPLSNTDLLGFAVGLMSGNGDQQGESPVPVILSHHLNCYALPLAMPIPVF